METDLTNTPWPMMGAAFRHIRMANRMTLTEAGAGAGIDHTHLSRFERGARRLNPTDLQALALAIGMGDVDTLTTEHTTCCEWCSRDVHGQRSSKRFCSDACRKAASRAGRTTHPAPAGVVYFLRRGDRVKIGTTVNLQQRVRQFQHDLDDLLGIIPGGSLIELAWHQQWQHLRHDDTVGREWFRLTSELLSAITGAVAAAGLDPTTVAAEHRAERLARRRQSVA